MLVNQNDSHVLSFLCELCESLLYLRCFGLVIDNEEVPLCTGWLGNMADAGE